MKPALLISFLLPVCLAFIQKDQPQPALNLKVFEKALVLVPGATYHIGQSDQDVPYSHVVQSRVVKIDSFYICKFEVSNAEYRIFVNDIRKKDTTLYKQMLPDTLVWRTNLAYNEPYVDYYFRHPAYANYPVVGVSHEQALAYCTWLTQKYMGMEKRKYKKVEFTLPSVEEWTYAAQGGQQLTPFPWSYYDMQNNKGQWLANFKIVPQSSIGYIELPVQNVYGKIENRKILTSSGGYIGQGGNDLTAPVNSYYPNGYGLHNMAGNVEELVREKGTTKGGSWNDTGYYLMNQVEEKYDSTNATSAERGFRFIMKIVK